jgi:hypothetical protein
MTQDKEIGKISEVNAEASSNTIQRERNKALADAAEQRVKAKRLLKLQSVLAYLKGESRFYSVVGTKPWGSLLGNYADSYITYVPPARQAKAIAKMFDELGDNNIIEYMVNNDLTMSLFDYDWTYTETQLDVMPDQSFHDLDYPDAEVAKAEHPVFVKVATRKAKICTSQFRILNNPKIQESHLPDYVASANLTADCLHFSKTNSSITPENVFDRMRKSASTYTHLPTNMYEPLQQGSTVANSLILATSIYYSMWQSPADSDFHLGPSTSYASASVPSVTRHTTITSQILEWFHLANMVPKLLYWGLIILLRTLLFALALVLILLVPSIRSQIKAIVDPKSEVYRNASPPLLLVLYFTLSLCTISDFVEKCILSRLPVKPLWNAALEWRQWQIFVNGRPMSMDNSPNMSKKKSQKNWKRPNFDSTVKKLKNFSKKLDTAAREKLSRVMEKYLTIDQDQFLATQAHLETSYQSFSNFATAMDHLLTRFEDKVVEMTSDEEISKLSDSIATKIISTMELYLDAHAQAKEQWNWMAFEPMMDTYVKMFQEQRKNWTSFGVGSIAFVVLTLWVAPIFFPIVVIYLLTYQTLLTFTSPTTWLVFMSLRQMLKGGWNRLTTLCGGASNYLKHTFAIPITALRRWVSRDQQLDARPL